MGAGDRRMEPTSPQPPGRAQYRVALVRHFAGDEIALMADPRPDDRRWPAPTLTMNPLIPALMVGTRREEEVFTTLFMLCFVLEISSSVAGWPDLENS